MNNRWEDAEKALSKWLHNRWQDEEKALTEWMQKYKELQIEIDRLTEVCKEYQATITRLDVLAEEMGRNYGRMVLERDRLAAEKQAQAERIEKLEAALVE